MKRRWPKSIWFGLALVFATPFLYLGLFIRYPITRDVPWPSLLMFAAGLGLILHGLLRAYRRSQQYRGKIVAPVVLTIGAAIAGFFCYVLLYQARQVPDSLGAPRVGQLAPDFTLPDQDGRPVSLAQLLGSNGVMLVFYRGWW